MRRFTKRTIVAVVGVSALAVGAGGAYAYWTNGGTGDGTATTGTNAAIIVKQTSTITGLVPGGAAQPLAGNFDNANSSPVFVEAVTATVTGTSAGAGCDASNYTIAGAAVVHAEVPAGLAKGSWSGLTIQFNDKPGSNQDLCKLATVNIHYTSN